MTTEPQYTQDDARKTLFNQIASAANDAHRITDASRRASVLNTLAEAYAWLSSPNQPH